MSYLLVFKISCSPELSTILFIFNILIYKVVFTSSYIVFRMAQSEPSSGVKGKAIYNKNLLN